MTSVDKVETHGDVKYGTHVKILLLILDAVYTLLPSETAQGTDDQTLLIIRFTLSNNKKM